MNNAAANVGPTLGVAAVHNHYIGGNAKAPQLLIPCAAKPSRFQLGRANPGLGLKRGLPKPIDRWECGDSALASLSPSAGILAPPSTVRLQGGNRFFDLLGEDADSHHPHPVEPRRGSLLDLLMGRDEDSSSLVLTLDFCRLGGSLRLLDVLVDHDLHFGRKLYLKGERPPGADELPERIFLSASGPST